MKVINNVKVTHIKEVRKEKKALFNPDRLGRVS